MQLSQQQLSTLQSGCDQLGLTLSVTQLEKISAFVLNLSKWNQAYNLTAIRNVDEMIIKHLLDSLAIVPYIKGDTLLDVGTGPGLPGIPLSIYDTSKQWTLIDSNGKKTRFLLQMKTELMLSNVTVLKGRIEQLSDQHQFHTITSRAFSSLTQFVGVCLPLLKPGGELVAMKGQLPTDEIQQLDTSRVRVTVEALNVPYLSDARHVIRVKPI